MNTKKNSIVLVIMITSLIYWGIVLTSCRHEKNHKRLKLEYTLDKRSALGAYPFIYVSVNNKFYDIYDTSITLNKDNYLKRIFNDDTITVKELPVSTEILEENLPKEKFISLYLEKKEGKNYYIIPRKFRLNTLFGDRTIKITAIALAAQYCYNFLIVIMSNDEIRVYDEDNYPAVYPWTKKL